MNKYYLIILLILSFPFHLHADQQPTITDGATTALKKHGAGLKKVANNKVAPAYNFRKAKWGMTKNQVKATEKGKPDKEDNRFLGYVGNVAGNDALIIYIFADNKLVRAKYSFTEKHSNKNDYINDFKELSRLLKSKYGEPKSDVYWRNDLYKDKYSKWGFAVSLGHLVYINKWETSDTTVIQMLRGENYKISSIIEYSSKSLKELEKKKRLKKKLDDL